MNLNGIHVHPPTSSHAHCGGGGAQALSTAPQLLQSYCSIHFTQMSNTRSSMVFLFYRRCIGFLGASTNKWLSDPVGSLRQWAVIISLFHLISFLLSQALLFLRQSSTATCVGCRRRSVAPATGSRIKIIFLYLPSSFCMSHLMLILKFLLEHSCCKHCKRCGSVSDMFCFQSLFANL